jgi:hypothetical protein
MSDLGRARSDELAATTSSQAWPLLVAGAALIAGVVVYMVTRAPVLAIAAMPVAAVAVYVLARRGAQEMAEQQAYRKWVAERGWAPVLNLPAGLVTPLLRAGDTRRLADGYGGQLDGLDAAIGHFTWESIHQTTDQYGNVHETRTQHHLTVLEALTGLESLTRMTLSPRLHGQGRLVDSVESLLTVDRAVDLESAEFAKAYRLFVADADDEVTVRRVFTPSLIVELVEIAGAGVAIEFETGALVCSVHGHTGDPDLLDALAHAASTVAAALAGQPAQQRGAA